jgi:hypothetical protein
VGRLTPAWLLSLPLLAAAWLSAHALAYELVPAAEHGHGYLEQAPLFLTLCATVATVALAGRVAGRRGRALPPWLAGLLPLLGFALQEHLERALAGGTVPSGTVLEPVFLVGLVLQLPFALAALVVARALAAVADALAPPAEPTRGFAPGFALPRPAQAESARPAVLARGHAGRAPPARA